MSLAVPALAQTQGQVAVVDMERAVNESAQGKKAQIELRRKAERLESELKALTDEVQNLRKDLENAAMVLKPEAKLAKERDFERKARQLNDRTRDAQQEIQEARRDAFAPILRDMQKVIGEIGVKGGYAVILEARTALYHPKSADVTPQVIAAFDKLRP
jgi:outer membrane protein